MRIQVEDAKQMRLRFRSMESLVIYVHQAAQFQLAQQMFHQVLLLPHNVLSRALRARNGAA